MDSVRAFWFPPSDTAFRLTTYDVSNQQIHVSGDLAVAEGHSSLAWENVFRGSIISSSTSSSDYLTVLRKTPAGWRILRNMYVVR
jgi:ketosteroid isomerase-like protein